MVSIIPDVVMHWDRLCGSSVSAICIHKFLIGFALLTLNLNSTLKQWQDVGANCSNNFIYFYCFYFLNFYWKNSICINKLKL